MIQMFLFGEKMGSSPHIMRGKKNPEVAIFR
jgi:hypothetical protein